MSTYIHENVTPNGNRFKLKCRIATNDANTANWVSKLDEYRLRGLELTGWALDIGAYTGAVAIPLAIDHPDLNIVAVEPVPENAALLGRNIDLNGVRGSVFLCSSAAASTDRELVPIHYGGTGQHRYVGNVGSEAPDADVIVHVRGITLAALLRRFRIKQVALMKIDCEGCEWGFLSDPAVGRVERIVGELHMTDGGFHLGHTLLRTHDVVMHDEYHFTAERL